jgi:molybdopterin-dependent oxidoreductase alpha subunit
LALLTELHAPPPFSGGGNVDVNKEPKIEAYDKPAGGWDSATAVAEILKREGASLGVLRDLLLRHNKPGGYACASCAWAKPSKPHPLEFCESGAKATAWELTSKRVDPAFFDAHSLAELETWPDYDLEEAGRLTHPMRWAESSNKYVPTTWDETFTEIGRELRKIDPNSVVFYTSGRASLEASYLYQLFARMLGTNNLPDSSNMCHESTSVALPQTIGVPVGTITLDDFDKCDAIFFLAQNVGTSAPRMLHELQRAAQRGVPIVSFDPMHVPALEFFQNPQSPSQMLTGSSTKISSQYHQVKVGGDIAALSGVCKALITSDDNNRSHHEAPVLDHDFIAEHTHGFQKFADFIRRCDWAELERRSGLKREAMEAAAASYAKADAVLIAYGMGLTQHRGGVENVQMLTNLLLLRGNIGKPGAGLCAVRGHSNVQGQRTVGITEKPELAPLDRLAELYGFEPPRDKGLDTVGSCRGMLNGKVRVFVGLGGNFIRAVPETVAIEAAWRKLRLTVQIATKLNRSQVIHGEIAFLLPCLGRLERDEQVTGPQAVTVEDSTAHFYGSRGKRTPASEHLLSEPRIVAEMAKATLMPDHFIDWDGWVGDYGRIRDAIEATYPEIFRDFNRRMWQPGGFEKPLAARQRKWNTKTGKATFVVPTRLSASIDIREDQVGVLQLTTIRSNDQFNTTIYSYDDRYRGVYGTRKVVLMNANDMARLGLREAETVTIVTEGGDQIKRVVRGMRVTAHDIPEGCCAGYYPECNPLIPLWHHAEGSNTPASKSIPVKLQKERYTDT